MPRSRPTVPALVAAAIALVGCSGSRDGGAGELPGGSATAPPSVFQPAPIPAAAEPLVDGLIANLTHGSALVARVDAANAPCVARRWIGILGPDDLLAAGVTAEAMTNVRLSAVPNLIPDVPLDEARAALLVGSFAECGVGYDASVLASMQSVGTIDATQRECIATALPDDLLRAVALSTLVDPEVDTTLDQRYRDAVTPCLD